MRRALHAWVVVLALVVAVVRPSEAADQAGAVSRGLATFVHGARSVGPGTRVPLVLVAYGFETLTTTKPLPGARFELAWSADHAGHQPQDLVPVRAVADGEGAARVEVTAPKRGEKWQLLVRTSYAGKERTDTLAFERVQSQRIELVPSVRQAHAGAPIHVWAQVDSDAGPVKNEPIKFAVLEGSAAYGELQARTDAAGRAEAELALPRGDALLAGWSITATTADGTGTVSIGLRDDTPGAARIDWEPETDTAPGKEAVRAGILRDATGEPMANTAFEWWAGPVAAAPKPDTGEPRDDSPWHKVARRARTDGLGRLELRSMLPTLVGQGGLVWRFVVHADLGEQRLDVTRDVGVGRSAHTLTLLPAERELVPGLENTLLLTADDGASNPVAGAGFKLDGDGLASSVTTNERGEALVRWKVPAAVGTHRSVEPCSGSIAANVAVIANAAAIQAGFPSRTDLCVPVDRIRKSSVRVEPPIARTGESVKISLHDARASFKAPKLASLLVHGEEAAVTRTALAKAGTATLSLEGLAPGRYTVSAVDVAGTSTGDTPILGRFLVTPARLPRPTATLTTTAHVPGGRAGIDVKLVDEKGAPFAGSVGAIVTDRARDPQSSAFAGDVRARYCTREGRDALRCDDLPTARELLAPAYLSQQPARSQAPQLDPRHTAEEHAKETFAEVVKSLEGAVYEASSSRDSIADVLRKTGGKNQFNPELLTLAVQALATPPRTPGDEPIALADLASLDPQVDFDHVARRVARYKLFQVLKLLREARGKRDADDFAYDEPNAWLSRLTRDSTISEGQLIDPWGGTIAFVRSSGHAPAFLTMRKGYELHAPGPDGRLGTADDVASPFERVLRAGSPYAKATDEESVVDAPHQVEVAESSIEAWNTTLETATGRSLGNVESGGGTGSGIGLGGGHGSGHGGMRGGATRVRGETGSGHRALVAPRPVGPDGRVHLDVPLGTEETVYRVLLVADVPGLGRLVESVDVPVHLSQSVRIASGERWTVGDEGDLGVLVENRLDTAASLEVVASAGAGVTLGTKGALPVKLPPRGRVRVPLRAKVTRAGIAEVGVVLRGARGAIVDHYRARWRVLPAGERVDLARTTWVRAKSTLERPTAAGHDAAGASWLELHTSAASVWRSALAAVEPARLRERRQAEDAHLLARAVEQAATARGDRELAKVARTLDERVLARASVLPMPESDNDRSGNCPQIPLVRLVRDEPQPRAKKSKDEDPFGRVVAAGACFDTQIAKLVEDLLAHGQSVELARAAIDLAERDGREPLAIALGIELRKRAHLAKDGSIAPTDISERSDRALVLAALLRTAEAPSNDAPAQADAIAPHLVAMQDAHGSFGSVEATSAAVRSLVAATWDPRGGARTVAVKVHLPDGVRTVQVQGTHRIPLPAGEGPVTVETESGAPLLARIVAPHVRRFSAAPVAPATMPEVRLDWPEAKATSTRLSVRVGRRGRPTTSELRVPLPPNVELDGPPATGVRVIDHVLRIPVPKAGLALQIALRTTRAGRFVAPEGGLYEGGERIVVVPAQVLSTR